jgi:hypothetical protein
MSNKRGRKSHIISPPPFRFRSYKQWGRKINIINKPRSRLIFGQLFKCCKHVLNWIVDIKTKAINKTFGDVNAPIFRHSLVEL